MGCHLAGPVWSCWSAKNTLILLWHRQKLRMLVRVQRDSVVESSDASIIQGTTHYGEKDKHDPTEACSNTSFPGFSYIKALIYKMTAWKYSLGENGFLEANSVVSTATGDCTNNSAVLHWSIITQLHMTGKNTLDKRECKKEIVLY